MCLSVTERDEETTEPPTGMRERETASEERGRDGERQRESDEREGRGSLSGGGQRGGQKRKRGSVPLCSMFSDHFGYLR